MSKLGLRRSETWLAQKRDLAFSIGKYYVPKEQEPEVKKALREARRVPKATPTAETIKLESQEMRTALEAFFASNASLSQSHPNYVYTEPLAAPYLFWYHNRSSTAFDDLSDNHRKYMLKLTSWIDKAYGEQYAKVNEQLKRGMVSHLSVVYLVKPGDVVILNSKPGHEDGVLSGQIVEDYPSSATSKPPKADPYEAPWQKKAKKDKKYLQKWSLPVWRYIYNGSFYRKQSVVHIEVGVDELEDEVSIDKLNIYPLEYASTETRSQLEDRGRRFWSCRERRLIAFEDSKGVYGVSTAGERFMVDFETHKQLHPYQNSSTNVDESMEKMEGGTFESDVPPPAPEIYVFPDTMPAYNLRTKKWHDLEVDQFRDVQWNRESFTHLVLDDESKELVHALVTNQIAREQGTDIIDSKGNGLIILLHGGPGTGKTYTAESVAELAEKPLFRVTCGDIGTKPEDVEKYLESVLHLSKIWGCVVLLDEAEVFLEKRMITDLERNALVLVFLRVLEYYEGILILTSNRVGTFDEAFKSRIQLSLHYDELSLGQRKKIWKNFLTRLKKMDQSPPMQITDPATRILKDAESINIDFDDVECYIDDLAQHDMNGRQIRNAITTARQLAKFKGERMVYKHLKHVITVSSKFDTYLVSVREGLTDKQVARGEGVR
ncbi:P-loop containing nucleoside triphosphate hydrolase protein [Plenodomus tracheiphilus IPT5]|uniref:P-loop containing nucleoside triphosphate hydrolase protein n=1 Tax=Plenodomus tracheiphilus IPT5 TaxID=1408161 RepID=A0A6A7BE83_9PLEO|nr:P-loop containing nucleoside triphosphate hydrolase protein [Plenodomus tracheiphilus IPT5]